MLEDPDLAARLGDSVWRRVRARYSSVRHLVQYAALLARIDAWREPFIVRRLL